MYVPNWLIKVIAPIHISGQHLRNQGKNQFQPVHLYFHYCLYVKKLFFHIDRANLPLLIFHSLSIRYLTNTQGLWGTIWGRGGPFGTGDHLGTYIFWYYSALVITPLDTPVILCNCLTGNVFFISAKILSLSTFGNLPTLFALSIL